MLDTKTKQLTEKLESKNLLEQIDNYTGRFFDEPRYFYYGTKLTEKTHALLDHDEYYHAEQSLGVGISFQSPYKAILKSLMEAIERFSLRIVNTKELSYKSFSRSEINTSRFFQSKSKGKIAPTTKIGMVKSMDLLSNTEAMIPAQTVYLESYRESRPDEPELTPLVSTGASAHFDKSSAILSGICELIERDAMMTAYLTSTPLSPIQLDTIPYRSIQEIIQKCRRYLLEPYIFILKNDLSLPVAMTILRDDTGLGPAITVGGGCSLDLEDAITHSLEEALSFRYFVRKKMNELQTVHFSIKQDKITDNTSMQLFWSAKEQVKHLDFWLGQKPVSFSYPKHSVSSLADVIRLCRIKSVSVFAKEITPSILRDTEISVVRVVMPTLQPLYLDRTKPYLHLKRLGTQSVNPIPHPIP